MEQQTRPDRPWENLPPEIDALVPALGPLADEIVEAIRAAIPTYAGPLEGPFGEAMRTGTEEALTQFVDMVRRPGVGRAAGREIYVRLGRIEARSGRSLDALLTAYRIGARVAWRRLADVGQRAGLSTEVLVDLAESIFAYIEELSAESAEGFAAEQAERAGEAQRRRSVLLALLVAVPPTDPAAIAAAAAEAGWQSPRTLAALVWSVDRGSRLASRLPLGTLAAPVEGVGCALVADPDAPGRRAELERTVGTTPVALGPTVAAADAARTFRRARLALALAVDGLVVADEHRAAIVLGAEPEVLAELADDRLAPLQGLTDLGRERLATTLLAWLRHQGDVRAAAGELVVHPQTVRYRLARLRECFGATLDDPDARFELELALRGTRAQGDSPRRP